MRLATLAILALLGLVGAGCNDLRDFRGPWAGDRVGEAPDLLVGPGTRAHLAIHDIDAHGIGATLAVDGLLPDQVIQSLYGAEADALANLTFAGSPLRVFLAFVPVPDGGGDALAVIALFDDRRIEVRLLRGGTTPLYAIFALAEAG